MVEPYKGQSDEEIDCEKVDVYRGGGNLQAKPDEYKVDPTTGLVKGTHGVSIETDPALLARFGDVRRIKVIPGTLRIVQRGRRRTHFEIVPRRPLTPEEYQDALNQVELE